MYTHSHALTYTHTHTLTHTHTHTHTHHIPYRYHSFFQTLLKVWRDEGMKGLYGGMSAHLIRVVPNTAIVFLTYEAVVQLIDNYNEKSLY